jgi:hypothetical protein
MIFVRYELLGSMEDLEEVIACHNEALTLRPPATQIIPLPSPILLVQFLLAMSCWVA